MRKEYDFSHGIRNPYLKKLKKPVTIRIEIDTIDYFKKSASEMDIPYQKLINLFLRDCALSGKKPSLKWPKSRPAARVRNAGAHKSANKQ